jgi:hypothetical protein
MDTDRGSPRSHPAAGLGAPTSDPLERRFLAFDRWAGRVLTAFATVALGAWFTTRMTATPDDTAAGLVVGVWLAPAGALFFLARRAVRRRWPGRWFLQLAPWAWLVGFWALIDAVFAIFG